MSLISFLDVPDVKEKFRQEFKVPKLATRMALLAPPLSRRYSLVGTAFDYLLRFWVQRHNHNVLSTPWVAELACQALYNRNADKDNRIYEINNNIVGTTDGKPPVPLDPEFIEASDLLKQAQSEHKVYLSSGEVTDELIRATIHLAQLDVIFRTRDIGSDLGKSHDEDVKDLRTLITIVVPQLFQTNKLCLLNPTFGKASRLVGGADADMVIDDMIIDIKTTKDFRLDPKHFFQLLGYYALYKMAGFDGFTLQSDITKPLLTKPVLKPKITRVAIYFSRHAHLEVIDLAAIVSQNTFPYFVEWFSDRARQYSTDMHS